MNTTRIQISLGGLILSINQLAGAVAIDNQLPYPSDTPSADEIAQQVYFVNHLYAVKNARFGDKKSPYVVLTKGKNTPAKITLMRRHLNNNYSNDKVRARDLVIFTKGRLRGMGILVTDFVDPDASLAISLWLPALRKIRRQAEPDHMDVWAGSDFTMGEIYLRRPSDETHELLAKTAFPGCLSVQTLDAALVSKLPSNPPKADCSTKGTQTWQLKSRPKTQAAWYDYRISWVDTRRYTDLRSEYYKDDKKIKVLDKSWTSMRLTDPRANYWNYWYAHTLATGHQSSAFIDAKQVGWNEKTNPKLWTERSLRKLKR